MISSTGVALIKRFESCRLKAYLDVKKVATIGWGSTGPDIHLGLVWTQKQCDDRFLHDINRFETSLLGMVTVELTQNQFDALMSFTYNCGDGGFKKSTLRKLLNNSDFEGASGQFKRWCRAGGRVIPDLVARRKTEAELFLRA